MRERTKRTWAKWQQLVFEQERGGQNVKAFCRERGLCRLYFFAWKKRLRERTCGKFVEVADMVRGEPRDAQGKLRDELDAWLPDQWKQSQAA
jgi:hypothetical protein